MNIYLGYDHAGKNLADGIKQSIIASGNQVFDMGSAGDAGDDYPDFAFMIAQKVMVDPESRGILICGTGAGMAMAANKVAGIRAAVATSEQEATLIRTDNNANILALAGRLTPADLAEKLVKIFLNTDFIGGRHQRRIDKITAYEKEHSLLSN